jgi:lipopolysaccharide/colanic/teichoic acid biosynthesis glycosyltransferase
MIIKRFFDFLASLIGLVILLPVFLVISILIKMQMEGPIFFTQYRIGHNARPFKMVKFCTMKSNPNGNTISVKGDSRITTLGALLRKYKIDELPELWNVLKGEMSLVGPRPDVPGYADQLIGDDRLVLSVRPGITGLASLKYSNEEELLSFQTNPQKYNDEILWPDKVRINVHYVRNRSFFLDFKIIIFTLMGKKMHYDL